MLKRTLAPITDKAWNEIDNRTEEVLKSLLTARKIVHVDGPKGLNHTVISEGKLKNVKGDTGEVRSGLYQVKPLGEVRISFELDKMELFNIDRGAKDVDLGPLENAAKKIALFEEDTIYNGNETLGIEGLKNTNESEQIDFGNDDVTIMSSISKGILKLKESFENKPYTLVVGQEAWERIHNVPGYPLSKRIENLLGDTEIILSHAVDGAYLLPAGHEDLEMVIGQDFSIGYEKENQNKIEFFITESFTFRILNPDIIVKYFVE